MPLYKYHGITLDNMKVNGTKQANDDVHLAQVLRDHNIILTSCEKQEELNENQYKLKLPEVCDFSREIGAMLVSGITINKAINIMARRDLKKKMKRIYGELNRSMQNGDSLSFAMNKLGRVFPELLINMFEAGEQRGSLYLTANKMASHYEKEHKLNNKIRSAATYPIMLSIVTVVVVLIIFVAVLPQFFTMFEGMDLPWTTIMMMNISQFLVQNFALVLVGLVFIIASIAYILHLPNVSFWLQMKQYRIPIIGKLLITISTARFARTFSSLYSSGISVIDSVKGCMGTIGNKYIVSQLEESIKRIRNGEMLSATLMHIEGLDIKLASSVEIGEETGKLGDILESLADYYDFEAESASTRLVSIMEPVSIVIMAVIIAFIMISVLVPIFQSYNNFGI